MPNTYVALRTETVATATSSVTFIIMQRLSKQF
jgi:hypothetical protein